MAERDERLSVPVRWAYGLGLAADGVKSNAFNVFLLFFYQQIVGLDASLCGLALFLAMVVDAITDPTVGVWSDGWHSRLGRRHPFMYAASVPLAACFLATFNPPEGLGQLALFAWLTIFAVATRFAMTLFVIPHQSLLPELSGDYDERTSLQALRTVFAWLFGLFNALLGYNVFLRATPDYPQGLLNPAGYPRFALWGASAMLVFTFASSLGTQRAALRSQVELSRTRQISLRQLPGALREAWQSAAYRAVVLAGLCLYTAFGMAENLRNYINTYLWGFTSEQLAIFLYIIMVASGLVLVTTRRLAASLGKRRLAILGCMGAGLLFPGTIALRLVGVLPGGGEPILLRVISFSVFFEYSSIIVAMTMVGSMIADITDEHELRTGSRQEGLLFSASTFLIKASSGLGVLVAGFVITLSGFPERVDPATLDPQSVWNLGAFAGLLNLVLWAAAILLFRTYGLGRERHVEIRRELEGRRLSHETPMQGGTQSKRFPSP